VELQLALVGSGRDSVVPRILPLVHLQEQGVFGADQRSNNLLSEHF
jgi:hypothetical protein